MLVARYHSRVLRVLAVDDHEAIRDHVSAWVAQTGVGVVIGVCATAADGLEACATQSVDVVLCDVHMPDMGGVAFASEVRRRFGNIRIVLFSAHRMDDTDDVFVLRKTATVEELRCALLGEAPPAWDATSRQDERSCGGSS
jgi:CheY-like chemotaxis protein